MFKRVLIALPLVFFVGCGGDDDGGDDAETDRAALTCETTRGSAKFALNAVTLPDSPTKYAVDLDGDGTADNQFGLIIAALTARGIDQSTEANAAVTSGAASLLIEIESSDPTFTLDGCPVVTLRDALPASSPPDFAATPVFTVDSAEASVGITLGKIGEKKDHELVSTGGEAGTLNLRMYFGDEVQSIPLVSPSLGGLVTVDGVTQGRLSGAIPAAALETSLGIPAAKAVQNLLAESDSPFVSSAILSTFDDGGTPSAACGTTCQDPDGGACAGINDGVVSICEVLTNALITELLAPDVHLFAEDGVTLAPNPDDANKDAMSFGIGISAVKASY